jgi:predicted ATP-grasp superfamily ATP-dependent carboligase
MGLWDGEPLDGEHLLQAPIEGRPASAVFVADGERSVVLGLTEQLIGRDELGGRGFCWCGNILPLADARHDTFAVLDSVEAMIAALTRRFGLRGVNGIDVVVAEGPHGLGHGRPRPYLVEVNPRYTASMELVEHAYGLNIFAHHVAAMEGDLPEFSLADRLQSGYAYLGKGVVYARRTLVMPETENWFERGRRDIPFPGERIESGHPVCTVLARGESRAGCWQNLLSRVGDVRREIGDV